MNLAKVTQIREKFYALRSELQELDNTPNDPAAVKAAIRRSVEAMEPYTGPLSDLPSHFVYDVAALDLNEPLRLADIKLLIGADAMIERMFDIVRPHCADGISASERASKRAKLMKEMHAAEIAEEQAVLAAFDRGEFIDRRGDFSPQALFEVWN